MSLHARYDVLRDVINNCVGYRILDDDDVIREGDETICGSMLLSTKFSEEWHVIEQGDECDCFIGRTVRDMNDSAHNGELDVSERMFRRRLDKETSK